MKKLNLILKKITVTVAALIVTFLFFLSAVEKKLSANIDFGYEFVRDTIVDLEEELSDNNTNAIEVLENKKNSYLNMLTNSTASETEKIEKLINQIDDEISVYKEYKNTQQTDAQNNYEAMNYSAANSLPTKAAISVIIAGFYFNGWDLAGELLSNMLHNNELNSEYEPVNYSNIMKTTLINTTIAYNNEVSGQAGFKLTENLSTIEEDAYYSFGTGLTYQKKYYNDNKVIIDIQDKYDFDINENSNKIIKLCYSAQENGILVPFYTVIRNKIILDGVVPFKYDIDGESATITGIGNVQDFSIPNEIKLFGYKSEIDNEMPLVPVTKIGDSAFEGCEFLNDIVLPETISSIGNNAFKNCRNLKNVIINKDSNGVVILGDNVFDGCNSALLIYVPKKRIAEYKNDDAWITYKDRIISENMSYDELVVDNNDVDITMNLESGQNAMYKMVIKNSNTYKFSLNYQNKVVVKFYDLNMTTIEGYAIYTNQVSSSAASRKFEAGSYYITLNFADNASNGEVNLNISIAHVHEYSYSWRNYTQHHYSCDCGDSGLEPHAVSASSASTCAIGGGGNYKKCLLCGGNASIGFVGPYSNGLLKSKNGSYILENGVVVLVDDDINLYLAGKLEFMNDGAVLNNYNKVIYYKLKEENLLCMER